MRVDAYFSADVETDGSIPGPYSMLSFALVFAGTYDGKTFQRPREYKSVFYRELKPISDNYVPEALRVSNLDRDALQASGWDPTEAMSSARDWIIETAGECTPVLAAYPVSFDWTWLYWYFERFLGSPSPFNHSRCFDIKTAISVVTGMTVSSASRKSLPEPLSSKYHHKHHAVHDAIEQADILARVFAFRDDSAKVGTTVGKLPRAKKAPEIQRKQA